jgi:hypothetical protein
MVTLELKNTLIHEQMQRDFGISYQRAERHLAKYLDGLATLVNEALQRERTAWERKGIYSLSLHRLANLGPQLGAKRQRLHAWLSQHGLSVVQIVERGDNIKGEVSRVRINEDLVTLHDPLRLQADASGRALDAYLAGDSASNAALVAELYPELDAILSRNDTQQLAAVFDAVPINVVSLEAYGVWVETNSQLSLAKRETYLRQVRTILAVARHLDGTFLQRKKASPFGRTYYAGVSVQSVNKTLRRAMLGHSWEYDMRSAAVTWKMGFAHDYLAAHSPGTAIRDAFRSTMLFLDDKRDWMESAARLTFTDENEITDWHRGLIKEAMQAISFGARVQERGWRAGNGEWQRPALAEILRNPEQRASFLSDSLVRRFIEEQRLLDRHLFNSAKSAPAIAENALLRNTGGSLSKSRVIAFLFQHAETEVMNIVRGKIAEFNRQRSDNEREIKILANVHDAIVLDRRLGVELKSEIELAIRAETGNRYWKIGAAKELSPFVAVGSAESILEARREETAHRARIAAETRAAKGYENI